MSHPWLTCSTTAQTLHLTICINALLLSPTVLQYRLQTNRKRKKCGLEAGHWGQYFLLLLYLPQFIPGSSNVNFFLEVWPYCLQRGLVTPCNTYSKDPGSGCFPCPVDFSIILLPSKWRHSFVLLGLGQEADGFGSTWHMDYWDAGRWEGSPWVGAHGYILKPWSSVVAVSQGERLQGYRCYRFSSAGLLQCFHCLGL